MRDSRGQFIKGNKGYWLDKKRPELKNTEASKTMFKVGLVPWNKGKKGVMPIAWNKGKKHSLCESCHRKTPNYGKNYKYEYQGI